MSKWLTLNMYIVNWEKLHHNILTYKISTWNLVYSTAVLLVMLWLTLLNFLSNKWYHFTARIKEHLVLVEQWASFDLSTLPVWVTVSRYTLFSSYSFPFANESCTFCLLMTIWISKRLLPDAEHITNLRWLAVVDSLNDNVTWTGTALSSAKVGYFFFFHLLLKPTREDGSGRVKE